MKYYLKTCFITLLCFFITTPLVFAADILVIETTPKIPKPFSRITIQVNSFLTPIDGARISWFIDGVPTKEGVGEKNIVIPTKDVGEKTLVKVVVVDYAGIRYEREITIIPGEVDLLWEASTYTPPFYKGKALPTYDSQIRLSAVARFSKNGSDPAQYGYSWKMGRTKELLGGSAIKAFTVKAGHPNSLIDIEVTASDNSSNGVARSLLSIRSVSPVIRFYEVAPLLGVQYAHALSSTKTTDGQYTIRMVPFFMSIIDREKGELSYIWDINNETSVERGISAEEKTFLKNNDTTTFINTVKVRNKSKILQEASGAIDITLQ